MTQYGNKMNTAAMGQNVSGMNPPTGAMAGRMGGPMDNTGRMTPGMDGMMGGGGMGARDNMGNMGNQMGTGGNMGNQMGTGGNMGNQMGTGGNMGNQMGTGGSMGSGMGNQMGSGMGGTGMSGNMGSGMGGNMGSGMGNQMGSGMGGSGMSGNMGSGMGNQMGSGMGNQMSGTGMGRDGMGRDMMGRDNMGTGMGSGMGSGMGNQMGSGMGSGMGNTSMSSGMMGSGTGMMGRGGMVSGGTTMSGTLMGGMSTSSSTMAMSGSMITGGYLPQQHNVDSLGLPEPVHRMIASMKDRKNMELTWKISGDNMATIITLSWSPMIANTTTSPTRWNSTPMLYKGPPQRTNSFVKRSDSQIALYNPQNFSNARLSNGDLRMLRESGYESWNYQNPGDTSGQQQRAAITYASSSDDKYMMEMMEKENRGLKTTATSQHGTVISNGGGGDAWKDKISKLQEKCAQIPKLVQFKLSQGAEGYGQNRAPGMWDSNTRTNNPSNPNPGVQNRAMVFEDSSDLDWASMLDKPGHRGQQQQPYDQYHQDQGYRGDQGNYQGTGYRDSPYAHGGDQRARGGAGGVSLPFEKVVYDYRSGVLRAKLKHIIVHHDPGGDVFDIVHPSMGEEYHGHLDIINRLEPIQDYSYHSGEDFAGRYQKQIQFMNKIAEEYLNDKNAGGKSRSIYHVID